MAFQALREAKISAPRCRLTPPSSPRKTTTHGPTRPMYKSRILAALDAEFDVFAGENQPPSILSSKLPPKQPNSSRSFSTAISSRRSFLTNAEAGASIDVPPVAANGKGKYKQTSVANSRITTTANLLLAEGSIEEVTVEEPDVHPQYSYKDFGPPTATVVYTQHEEEANDLISCLKHPLGFDMEWRFFFRRKIGGSTTVQERRTAVVQLCDTKMILVIQISAMKHFPKKLKEVIESDDIWKCGVNIRNDAMKLYRDFGILSRRCAELGAMAHQADENFKKRYKRNIVSLQKIVDMYLSKHLVKPPVRTSNWEASPLTREQVEYAANDAHSALMVFRRLQAIAAEHVPPVDLEFIRGLFDVDLKKESEAGKLTGYKATKSTAPSEPSEAAAITTSSNTGAGPYITPSSDTPTTTSVGVSSEQQEHINAYNMWHEGKMSLYEICVACNRNKGGVIMFILKALQADPSLPYDLGKLTELVNKNARTLAFFREWRAQLAREQLLDGMVPRPRH